MTCSRHATQHLGISLGIVVGTRETSGRTQMQRMLVLYQRIASTSGDCRWKTTRAKGGPRGEGAKSSAVL